MCSACMVVDAVNESCGCALSINRSSDGALALLLLPGDEVQRLSCCACGC